MNNNQYYFDAYFELIKFTDEKITHLEDIHSSCMKCGKGCDSCCSEMTVLPVEFFAIASVLKGSGPVIPASGNCSLLKDGLCQIYVNRPLICRTHGLPLVYCEDDDPWVKNISFCELNFTDCATEFGPSNTLDMDEINIELVRLNEQFVKTCEKELPERMDLKDLPAYI